MARLHAIALVAAGCLSTACGRSEHQAPIGAPWQSPGWHFAFENDGDSGIALYRFHNGSSTHFSALCSGGLIFMLRNGSYDGSARFFSLEIDDRHWTLPADPGDLDGNSSTLFVMDPKFADYFAQAKHRIAYRVGTWKVAFAPSPLLSRLISQCHARNRS